MDGYVACAGALSDSAPPVCVLRDFWRQPFVAAHKQGRHRVGVIDVQDALAGPPAYDLVSLLQDARIDVPRPVFDRCLNHYVQRRFDTATGAARRFREAFAILGLQRNLKITGIFVRLALRDNKPQYQAICRVSWIMCKPIWRMRRQPRYAVGWKPMPDWAADE